MSEQQKCIHHDEILQYAEDVINNPVDPWLCWEFITFDESDWRQCDAHPRWFIDVKYRRKPKTIRIGEFDVPEPIRMAPCEIVRCFYPEIGQNPKVGSVLYSANTWHNKLIEYGLLHLSQESAQAHLDALLSLSRKHGRMLVL